MVHAPSAIWLGILAILAACSLSQAASTSATWDFLDPQPDYLGTFHNADSAPLIGDGGNNSLGLPDVPLAQISGLDWVLGGWFNGEVSSSWGMIFFIPDWLTPSAATHVSVSMTYQGSEPDVYQIFGDPHPLQGVEQSVVTTPLTFGFERVEQWVLTPSSPRTRITVLVRPGCFLDSVTIDTSSLASIAGDLNLDGVVNILDANVVSQHWGGGGPAGDANGDGTVNMFDVNVVSLNWTYSPSVAPQWANEVAGPDYGIAGDAASTTARGSRVDEPPTWVLVASAVGVIAWAMR